MWMDAKYGVTKELLKIFNFYRYPYVIFTRSDLVAHEDYLQLLDPDLAAVQMSISGNNQRFIRSIEPGAPSYQRRINALATMTKAGIWTTVRVNPLFPRFPDGYYTKPEDVTARFGSKSKAPELPFYNDEFVGEIADAGVPTLLAGFVRLSSRSINRISTVTGVDVKAFFNPEINQGLGDKHYSDAEIAYYYKLFAKQCSQHKIRFTTCYIGNGIKDYYQYQKLWANKRDCCDVIGNVKNAKSTSQQIDWDTRIKHAPDKVSAQKARDKDLSSQKNTVQSKAFVLEGPLPLSQDKL